MTQLCERNGFGTSLLGLLRYTWKNTNTKNTFSWDSFKRFIKKQGVYFSPVNTNMVDFDPKKRSTTVLNADASAISYYNGW